MPLNNWHSFVGILMTTFSVTPKFPAMKRTNKLTTSITGSFLLVMFFCSCTKDTPKDVIYVIRGNAEPAVAATTSSPAFGTINGGYSATYKKIAFNINWYNLSSAPTGTSFYFGDPGGTGKIKSFAVTEGNRNGLTASEMFLTDSQVQSLLNGNWYYSVNTEDHPTGEITGKLMVLKTE